MIREDLTPENAKFVSQMIEIELESMWRFDPKGLNIPDQMLTGLIAIMQTYAQEGETLEELMVRAKLTMA